MNKPFNNKSSVDPGRLRYNLSFYTQVVIQNEYGNSEVTQTLNKELKAAKLQIGNNDQLALQAGASTLNNDVYFIIRIQKNWSPDKTMQVQCDGKTYKLHSIIDLDQPAHYLKLLCIWQG